MLFLSPGVIPDESKAMSLLAPANAVAGMMPGGGLLPTPNPLATVSYLHDPFGSLSSRPPSHPTDKSSFCSWQSQNFERCQDWKKDHNNSFYQNTLLIIKTRWRVASAGCSIKRLVTSAVQSALLLKSLLVSQMGATPFGGLGASNMEQMAAMGMQGANMNPQVSAWSVTYVVAPINKMSHGHFLFRPFLQTSWSSCSPWTPSKTQSTLSLGGSNPLRRDSSVAEKQC